MLSPMLSMANSSDILLVVLATIILLYYFTGAKRSHQARLPPGPKGWAVIGNLLDVPDEEQWVEYKRWGEEYKTDIVSYRVFGKPVIVLNSIRAATELFERRSTRYSDRPRTPLVGELLGWSLFVGFRHYGDQWRIHRKQLHLYLHPRAIEKHNDMQALVTRQLMSNLVRDPQGFVGHVKKQSSHLSLKVAYGYDLGEGETDYFVDITDKTLTRLNDLTSGLFLIDYLPFLKHIPSYILPLKSRRQADEGRRWTLAMRDELYAWTDKQMRAGTADPNCFVAQSKDLLLQNEKIDPAEVEEITINNASSFYAGGAGTTMTAILTFILAMLVHPSVQRKAQAELDALLPSYERLPTLQDKDHLPYIQSIVKEVFRWMPPLPTGVAHTCMEDDEFDGWFIPKGAMVIGNAWAMLHDEEIYPEPHLFNPDRFSPAPGKPTPPDSTLVATFGFGRRVCLGRYFALNTLWITVATLLYTFDILPAVDEEGREVVPEVGWVSGLITVPKPYKCSFRPRSERVLELLKD